MPDNKTTADLIELAVQGERQAEEFYLRLAEMFAAHPQIEAFWQEYAREENAHACWLETLRGRIGAERLSEPVDEGLIQQAVRAIATPPEAYLAGIHNLQQAYDTANELEHSETNTVFEFLVSNFADDMQTRAFLRAQLSEHVGRLLMKFPDQYRFPMIRKSVLVQIK